MRITKKKWLSIPLVGIIIIISCRSIYTEFEPMLFNDDCYRKIEVDSSFYKNLKIVFDKYNVPYKIDEEGKVLVRRQLNNNKELVFNYTKKALDTTWINSSH